MTLRQLSYFRTLATVLNYSKAAEKLYISQPGLSSTISALEEELGVNLFERNGRQLELTQYGITLLHYVGIALDNISTAVEKISVQNADSVRIGYLYSIPIDLITALIERFCGETSYSAPNFKQFIFESNDSVIDALKSDKIDIAFCINGSSDFIKTITFYQHIYFAVSKNNPLSKKESIRFEDIAHMPCALPDNGTSLRRIIHDLYKEHGLEPEILSAPSITVAISYAMAENCYTIVPTLPAVDFSKLSILNVEEIVLKRPIYMIHSKISTMPTIGQKFVDFINTYSRTSGQKIIK